MLHGDNKAKAKVVSTVYLLAPLTRLPADAQKVKRKTRNEKKDRYRVAVSRN
jgi:hypothetical protein